MKEHNTSKELDFGLNDNESKPYYKIKTEFRKKGRKLLTYIFVILIIFVIHFALIYPIYLIPDEGVFISGLTPYRFNLTINWTVFSISTFGIFYLIKIVFMKFTPSLKEQIINDINILGFKFQEKRQSWILFLILNSISGLLLFLIELDIISVNNPIITMLFKWVLIAFLCISILVPIFWRIFYDGLKIKLKDKYHVSINPYYKIGKKDAKDSKLIGIFLTSNKIFNKFNKNKKKLYIQITSARWLPRKRKTIVSKYGLSPFLRFYEFSTPLNFQKQFLNIVLALQEWDTKKSI